MLWIAPAERRFFVVPEGRPLPRGLGVVVSLAGDAARVDLGGLEEHEVGLDEAAARFREEVRRGAVGAKAAVSAAWRRIEEAAPGLADALDRIEAGEEDGGVVLGALLGRAPEELARDPRGTERALDAVSRDLTMLLGTAPAGVAGAAPASAGGGLSQRDAERLADVVEDLWGASRGEVEELVRDLVPAAGREGLSLERLVRLAALLDEGVEAPSRRQERYRADARRNIEEATAGWKAPRPTFQELLRGGPEDEGEA